MMDGDAADAIANRPRLAIVGCGSSGLICLKNAIDTLQGWEIVCYEKSGSVTGCWGDPYPGFVSTSTKYTTQFACFPEVDASCNADHGQSRSEFFRNDEYGGYLNRFADEFSLRKNIKLHTSVEKVKRPAKGTGWDLTINDCNNSQSLNTIEHFEYVILCTGLAADAKQIDCNIKSLSKSELNHRDGLAHVKK